MPHVIADRVLEASTSSGTGPFALAGAVLGYRAFSAVCALTDTVPYYIEAVDAAGRPTGDWEFGLGTYSAANQLTRTTIRGSSNGGLAVSFPAGSKLVGLGVPAPNSPTTRAEWRAALGLSPLGDSIVTAPNAAAVRALIGGYKEIQDVSASVAGNALTLTLSPTVLDFRHPTLNNGTSNTREVAAPVTLTISNGSTLGTTNGVLARLLLLAIDNGGVVELAVVNQAGVPTLNETQLISTTAEGGAGAADSATTIYSAVARANVPFRVVGFVDITQATAGQWATDPSQVQGAGGGSSLLGAAQFGVGQTVQSVTRTAGVTYYNLTGRPIYLGSNINGASASASTSIQINGGPAFTYVNAAAGTGPVSSFGGIPIPLGASYVLSDLGVSARSNFELR
ncbi:hypothetical protein [Hydrogenophaga sp. T2]|uniref:hypothetical protein n=1 Tax=Hydrogenophaga sp. T2 TaxID=3132823 RepID=UPI003CF9B819